MAEIVLGISPAKSAAGSALTAGLPANPDRYHYITHILIQAYATAARTGAATPIEVTSTNLPGNPSWLFETAQAIGTIIERKVEPSEPIKSSALNTATSIVCPATASVIWKVVVMYRTEI